MVGWMWVVAAPYRGRATDATRAKPCSIDQRGGAEDVWGSRHLGRSSAFLVPLNDLLAMQRAYESHAVPQTLLGRFSLDKTGDRGVF